ncbi:MAG TPA: alpha/beta hydrolase [Lichenihabitans sp.]|jgi:lysophospholipase|nr:alpha/beta hydrolase [Lichenihabitans sp.]
MDLVETAFKAPPGAIVSPVVSRGQVVLRTARWLPRLGPAKAGQGPGTVVICAGRSEFVEKYYEAIGDLLERGFTVVAFDWRGQGLSSRVLRNRLKGHVGDFARYRDDLAAVTAQLLEPFCPRPWYALAHSMGGTAALHFAAERPDVFERMVLSAPMIDLAGLRNPNLMRAVARIARHLGLGRGFIPVGRRRALFLSTFPGNVLTSDEPRFSRTAALLEVRPDLALGPPTIGWAWAAFKSMAKFKEEDFVQRLTTPTLFILAGADTVVDGRAAERLSARLRASTIVTVRGARHELLMERDVFRRQFWSAFDAFVPGMANPDLALDRTKEMQKSHGSTVA